MGKFVECPICGAKFSTTRPNKKYCSFTCKEAGTILRRILWAQKNPNYNAEYQKARREKEREKKDEKKVGL